MKKEEFSTLLRGRTFQKEDLEHLDTLIDKYPWFSIPRFMKLKAAHQLDLPLGEEEISKLSVFSNDRKYLYQWMRDELQPAEMTSAFRKSEIEFINEDKDGVNGSNSSFELMDDDEDGEVDETEAKAIPEKDEVEMEEPEIEEPVPLPVIDSIEEDPDDITETPTEETDSVSVEQDEPRTESREIIEQFLKAEPGVIKADHKTSLTGDVSEDSVKEDDRFITDTLAKIYVKQGLHAKAIYAYERLSLKYPEKSAYFAAQIEKIRNINHS